MADPITTTEVPVATLVPHPKLRWTFHGRSEWTAPSIAKYEAESEDLIYRISVDENGLFDVSESDPELIPEPSVPLLHALANAKAWCQRRDEALASK